MARVVPELGTAGGAARVPRSIIRSTLSLKAALRFTGSVSGGCSRILLASIRRRDNDSGGAEGAPVPLCRVVEGNVSPAGVGAMTFRSCKGSLPVELAVAVPVLAALLLLLVAVLLRVVIPAIVFVAAPL
jgi:hypothetical protein